MIKFEALVNAIQDAVVKANDALMDKNVGLLDTYFEKDTNSEGEDVLTPKVYNLKYPKPTNNGIVMIDVEVPLLTLAPMVTSQIEELKFNTNLEVTLVNDELHVGFPSDAAPKRRLFEKSSDKDGDRSNTSIEIVIKPQEVSEGLKKLIQGYEKVLRSQIPN